MRGPETRFTIATEEDVEQLASKWSFVEGGLELKGISGFLEINHIRPLAPRIRDLVNVTESIRITSRSSGEIGDLFFSDILPGLTIEVRQKTLKVPGADVQVSALLRALLHSPMRDDPPLSTFVDVCGTQVMHSEYTSFFFLRDLALSDTFPEVGFMFEDINLVELTIDVVESKAQLRTIERLPKDLSFTKKRTTKAEVGIVQRQRRHLQDAEYKGLSTFLPGSDMSPFMIFFDKRLETHTAKPHGSYRTSVEGTGSHLSFSTVVERAQVAPEYQLPKEYFFDIYELEEMYPERFQIFGELDLEKPVWQISPWGSILYLELTDGTDLERFSVPFHARYFEPTFGGANERMEIPSPQVFAACPRPDAAFTDNPWDSFTIKQSVLGDENSFEFLQNNGSTKLHVSAALADEFAHDSTTVVTLLVIVLGFLYVLSKIVTASARRIPMVDDQIRVKHGKAE